jgi:hypothetical protein
LSPLPAEYLYRASAPFLDIPRGIPSLLKGGLSQQNVNAEWRQRSLLCFFDRSLVSGDVFGSGFLHHNVLEAC